MMLYTTNNDNGYGWCFDAMMVVGELKKEKSTIDSALCLGCKSKNEISYNNVLKNIAARLSRPPEAARPLPVVRPAQVGGAKSITTGRYNGAALEYKSRPFESHKE